MTVVKQIFAMVLSMFDVRCTMYKELHL